MIKNVYSPKSLNFQKENLREKTHVHLAFFSPSFTLPSYLSCYPNSNKKISIVYPVFSSSFPSLYLSLNSINLKKVIIHKYTKPNYIIMGNSMSVNLS